MNTATTAPTSDDALRATWAYFTCAAQIFGAKADALGLKDEAADSDLPHELPTPLPQENFSHYPFFEASADGIDAPGRSALRALLSWDASQIATVTPDANHDAMGASPPLPGHELNTSQDAALVAALTQDVSVIHGPPGTGKTQVIIALLHRIAMMEGKTAALVSQNQAAISNVVGKIHDLGTRGDAGLAFAEKVAVLGNKNHRDAYPRRNPVKHPSSDFTWDKKRPETKPEADKFLAEHPIITSTIHSLPQLFTHHPSHQFDYVIIDEASQTHPITGMLAAYYAKHLVLVGDPEQIPPIISGRSTAFANHLLTLSDHEHVVPERVRLDDRRSFLDMWLELLGGTRSDACHFLDEHYRCHPGIIQFCNENFYDNRLTVKTLLSKDDPSPDDVPIAIRWFDGAYGESFATDKARQRAQLTNTEATTTRRNMRQLAIFMKEEWPRLQDRLAATRDPSEPAIDGRDELTVGVLSPYRGQLTELETLLRGQKHADRLHMIAAREEDEERLAPLDTAAPSAGTNVTTIHRSQGREYDIVYLLPVDEGSWENPWSQRRQLINVAVSRAKKELRVITSSSVMSEETQKALHERDAALRTVPRAPATADAIEDPDAASYLGRLVDYVGEHQNDGSEPSGFGLLGTGLPSVFDNAVYCDQVTSDVHRDVVSGPEWSLCEELAASGLLDEYVVLSEPHAGDILKGIDVNEMRFDLVIADKEWCPLLAIEVDGLHHRHIPNKKGRNIDKKVSDADKDRACLKAGGKVIASLPERPIDGHVDAAPFMLLRMPTDGRSFAELDRLRQQTDPPELATRLTIEDLLRAQRTSAGTPLAMLGERVPLSRYLSRHPVKKPDGSVVQTHEANEILRKNKYLKQVRNTREIDGPSVGDRATEAKGRELGILTRVRYDTKGRHLYWSPVYDPEEGAVADFLRKHLG